MSAEKGNKYAEKISLEDAINLVELAYSNIDDDCFFLSDLADRCDTYRQKFEYILEKFNDDEKVFNTIKKIYNKCESIVMKKTANNEIAVALGIFVLKSYHGLMETSKQQIEANVTDTKTDLSNLSDLEILQLTKLQQKAKGD